MADATRTTRSVEKTVTVDEDVVVLTLTVHEAKTLRTVVAHVAGPTDGPRGDMDNVSKALYAADLGRDNIGGTGTIRFGYGNG